MQPTQPTTSDGDSRKRAFTIAQAAELLGVHRVTLWRRVCAGDIKVLSGFGRLTIPAAELDKFLGKVVEHKAGTRRKPKERRGNVT